MQTVSPYSPPLFNSKGSLLDPMPCPLLFYLITHLVDLSISIYREAPYSFFFFFIATQHSIIWRNLNLTSLLLVDDGYAIQSCDKMT